jgi:hypothetical protein
MIIGPRQECKHIKLCIVEETEDFVRFYIKSQTHIGSNFAIDGKGHLFFSEKTGWYLKSLSVPEVREYEFTLFTRGIDQTLDKAKLRVSKQAFETIQETINDYNETFSGRCAEIPEEQLVYVQSRRKNVVCKPFKEAHMFVRIGTELSDFNK